MARGLRAIVALVLSLFTALAWQAADWLGRNGWQASGRCVNHFGEAYGCTLADWLLRAISPLAWPALLLAWGVWMVVLRVVARRRRSQR